MGKLTGEKNLHDILDPLYTEYVDPSEEQNELIKSYLRAFLFGLDLGTLEAPFIMGSGMGRMNGITNSVKWWHPGYVDDLTNTDIILGIKESAEGMSTLGSATRSTAMSAGKIGLVKVPRKYWMAQVT